METNSDLTSTTYSRDKGKMHIRWGQMAIFRLFEVGMKYVWPGTYRSPSSSPPASKNQPYQGAGLHKFEATVGKVKNKMLMGIKMTVY